jgi:hypothetical protein
MGVSEYNSLILNGSVQNNLESGILRIFTKDNDQNIIYDETALIGINSYLVGSSNCNFILKRNQEELLVINNNSTIIKNKIITDNINILNEGQINNLIIDDSLLINTSNVNIHNDIILSSNININKETYFNSNIYTDTLYVNNIDNVSGNDITINNLKLNQSVFNDARLLDTVTIQRNNNLHSNIIQINVNDNTQLENIIEYSNILKINKNGEIAVKDTLNINSNSLYLPKLSIDEQNNLSIGKIKKYINVVDYESKVEWNSNNYSLLHINRNDNNSEYNIIKDPLLYITADYNPDNNIINTNYDKTNLILSNLVLTIEKVFVLTDYMLYFHILPDINYANWYSNETPIAFNINIDSTNISIFIPNYDYNNYNLFYNKNVLSNISPNIYDFDIYIGFNKSIESKNTIDEIINTYTDPAIIGYNIEENTDLNNIGYYNLIRDNYEFDTITTLNINIHVFYEKSDNDEYIYFLNKNPILKECPLIMNCVFNNDSIMELNSNGLLKINDLEVLHADIPDINLNNINTSINLKNNNINNVNNIKTTTLEATSITTDSITILGDQKIEFTEIDTSNFNSDFFKYNNTRTNFFNEFTICKGKIDYSYIEQYRSTKNITEFLVSTVNNLSNNEVINEDVIYIDGNMKIAGELKFNDKSIKYNNNRLTLNDNQLTIDNNIISIANNNIQALGNTNKIWIGDHNKLSYLHDNGEYSLNRSFDQVSIYENTLGTSYNEFLNYSNYFYNFNKTIVDTTDIKSYANNYNINIFGNTRFANINNKTIIEVSDYNVTLDNIAKHSMNVYGNIKCSKPSNFGEIINEIALTADGDVKIEGNMEIKSNINAEGFISTDRYVEAKQGVRNISDSRVKYDIKKIDNALNKIKLLTGYTFKRNDLNGINDTGLLAQDVKPILPEVVNENSEGILSIEYAKMMGLIIESIKELSDKIDLIK